MVNVFFFFIAIIIIIIIIITITKWILKQNIISCHIFWLKYTLKGPQKLSLWRFLGWTAS